MIRPSCPLAAVAVHPFIRLSAHHHLNSPPSQLTTISAHHHLNSHSFSSPFGLHTLPLKPPFRFLPSAFCHLSSTISAASYQGIGSPQLASGQAILGHRSSHSKVDWLDLWLPLLLFSCQLDRLTLCIASLLLAPFIHLLSFTRTPTYPRSLLVQSSCHSTRSGSHSQ